MVTKPTKNNQESESLQEQIIKLEKQLESFKHSNEHFLKNKLFLHYDIKEPEKVVVDCETKLPVLAEVDKKKILKGKESDPTHLIIEGDNYHALSVLNYTHAGKIDLIYIDPPYNTGNKDFIYNDRFVDREDSFRHSKWLSFMTHRLRLAKNLLAETGVIFISIDDNEQAHLRLLCDQIFKEENFIAQIVWHRKRGKDNSAKFLSRVHEYILVYSKNAELLSFNRIDLSEQTLAQYTNPDNDKRGRYRKLALWRRGGQGGSRSFSFKTKEGIMISSRSWLVNEETMKKLDEENKLVVIGDNLYRKLFLSEHDGSIPETIWLDASNTANATDMIKEIFGKSVFDTPKPIELIKRIIHIGSNKESLILDFMAGSGTTGHAVLELNKEDGGTRQFILCTNNENKIAEDVTYPRIKKVIAGYGDNAPTPANLRYFQTDFVEKKGSVSQLKIDLTRQCAEMLCVKENVFEAVKIKKAAKNYKFFKNGDKYLGVFFDFFTDPEFTDFIAELNTLPKEAEKAVYIFVLDGSASIFADEFAGVANCEIKEIPQKILDIYKQLAREVARK